MATTSSYFILSRRDGPPDNQTEVYFSGTRFVPFDPMKVQKFTSMTELGRCYDGFAAEVKLSVRVRVLVEEVTTVINPDHRRVAAVSIDYYIAN